VATCGPAKPGHYRYAAQVGTGTVGEIVYDAVYTILHGFRTEVHQQA